MINFLGVFWQNFLSTGNVGTTVALNGAPTTLIIGKNGHGKSTLLDALCFALYGKPFRNITKNQLVNSVNLKNCKVWITFETEGKQYKVVRGIKPNVFEIYIDGQLLSQDAATKDYQKVLEKQILKMNYKTFTQVVILGAASFTPFMQLSAGHRREVIEDILDIKIFSTMSAVLKDKVSETKTALVELGHDLTRIKGRVESQRALIVVMKKSKEENAKEIDDKIDINNRRIEALEKDLAILDTQISDKAAEISSMNDSEHKLMEVETRWNTENRKLQKAVSDLSFFENHDDCPICKQGITTDHKAGMVADLETERERVLLDQQKLKVERAEVMAQLHEYKRAFSELQQLQIDYKGIQSEIKTIGRQTAEYEDKKKLSAADTGDIDAEKAKLKQLASDATQLLEDKIDLTEKRNMQEVATTLLKDTGIKTNVVREYLPLMNKLINKYLQIQDSFIQFEIDEQFEETIKSRYRDEFSYASFSEGERQRIDLSILFTWRQVARMKNSANTNLLVMDEVLDGSLDDEGNDSAHALIDSLVKEGSHVIVVSHSVDAHIEKFDRVLKFEKKGNYSLMAETK